MKNTSTLQMTSSIKPKINQSEDEEDINNEKKETMIRALDKSLELT